MINEQESNEVAAADNKPEMSDDEKEKLKQQMQEFLAKTKQARQEKVKIDTSANIVEWFNDTNTSLMFTTGSTSKLFSLGVSEEQKITVGERHFDRCGPLVAHGDSTLYMGTHFQVWRLDNSVPAGKDIQGFDRFYTPQQSFVTGDLQIQDLAVDSQGRLLFVNALFSCLAAVSPQHSFIPLWKPKFISQLVAENRCQLSGLAMEGDRPKVVSSMSDSDDKQGWVNGRKDSGVLIDVPTNEIIATGLSMPYCPRFYQDKLWLLNAGSGYLGYVDQATGAFNEVAFCAGLARCVSFVDHYAVVGVCRPKNLDDFADVALVDNLKKHGETAQSGIIIIDLNTGEKVHYLTFDRVINEVVSVQLLPHVKRPAALGLNMPEMARMITVGTPAKRTAPGGDSKH